MVLHQLSKSILKKIVDAKYKLFIPSVCLIEICSVISRLTNDYELSQNAVNFIRNHSIILFDNHLLENMYRKRATGIAIGIGALVAFFRGRNRNRKI